MAIGKSASDIAIRIGADFVGIGAFKKADTAVDKLYKGTQRLAGAFGLAFSAAGLARFGVRAVKAFAAEEKQVAALTASVRNLGLAFAAPEVNTFIENMERATGIAREELQPAFQALLTQTGSITRSQEILAAAIEVSFSGLMSVSEAANILTQAYVGNNRGLRQLNLGLTTAEINAMNFDQVLRKVSATYKNQYAAALDTTQVKINKFNVAIGNSIEYIGEGLVNAFGNFAGSGDVDRANAKLESFAKNFGEIIGKANALDLAKFVVNPLTLIAESLTKRTTKTTMGAQIGSPAQWRAQNQAITKAQNASLAAEKKRLDLLKKQSAEKRAQVAIDNANKALAGAKGMFDLEGIQIAAALQGNITQEQRARLELMQKIYELEQAIASGNTSLIEKLTEQLLLLTQQTTALNTNLQALEKIADALNKLGYDRKLFNLDNLTASLALIQQIGGASYTPATFAASGIPSNLYPALLMDLPNAAAESVVVPEVNISIEGSVSDLINVVVDGLQQQSASGISTRIARNTGGFNW